MIRYVVVVPAVVVVGWLLHPSLLAATPSLLFLIIRLLVPIFAAAAGRSCPCA